MPPKQPVRLTNEIIWDGTLTVSLAAVALPEREATEVFIQADPQNGGDVFVGNVTSQSVQLDAGERMTILINNSAKVYVRGSAINQVVNWHVLGI